jgi:hypothetical protein
MNCSPHRDVLIFDIHINLYQKIQGAPMKQSIIFLLTAGLILAISCNKKVSEQIKAYEDNMLTIQKYQEKYPALKAGLDETIQSVNEIWKASEEEKDKEVKLAKKKIVNNAIRNDKLFWEISVYEEKTAKARELIKRLRAVSEPKFIERIKKSTGEAETAIAAAEKSIKESAPGTLQEAVVVMLKVNGECAKAVNALIDVQNAVSAGAGGK